MKKEANKNNTEAQLLDLLKKVLPKATHDPALAGKIYDAVANELKVKARAAAFDKFCNKVELPDLEHKSVESVKKQLSASFGDADIAVKPDKKEQLLAVEVGMKDGTQFAGTIKVNPDGGVEISDEQEITFKFIPFPVVMPGDTELVWYLAKRENMSPDEANVALSKVEEEFWASKSGQKLLRDRVDKTFPEFISRVPGGKLSELGLKRHYKTPEAIQVFRAIKPPESGGKKKE
jgi:hypothetical protein